MHILIFSFPYASAMGGGERYTEQMVAELTKKGHNFTLVSSSRALQKVFSRHGWKQYALFGGFEPVTKLNIFLFALLAPVFILIQGAVLLWFKFKYKTDTLICLSLTDKIIATPMADALKMKVIWMEHLIPGRALKMNPYRGLYVSESKRARIVTVSRAAREGLVELGLPKDRITIIPPGVVIPSKPLICHPEQGRGILQRFLDEPEMTKRVPAPRSLGEAGSSQASSLVIPSKAGGSIPDVLQSRSTDAPVIGCVTRLHKEKNVQLLLDTFTEVLREIPDAQLEIYGDGPEREQLESVVKERRQANSVTFHGWVDSKKGFYNDFHVLAVPSKKESFGMAALEAEAHGIPVVATKVGGLVEAVAHQVTGLLVPWDDADAMARALIRVLKDKELAEKLGRQGRALAEDLYSEQKLIDAWDSLLNA